MFNLKIFGEADARTIEQIERCASAGNADYAVLCADNHVGYSQPIGGAIAYENYISPSGVGYDIACGNKAALTDAKAGDLDIAKVMDEVSAQISFGVGRRAKVMTDHPVLEKIRNAPFAPQRKLAKLAEEQLGTVGGGNHYVDIFKDEEDRIWIGLHFGSRGFGHRTATGFLAIAQGQSFEDNASEGEMDSPPILFDIKSQAGQDYIEAMNLAGEYAYAGRDIVVAQVAKILGANILKEVHNHHNFAWYENHFGKNYWIVRKGCTPAFPDQESFVGSTMGDISVILKGVDSDESRQALYSTVHGAGRVMSRRRAAGSFRWFKKHGQRFRRQVQRGVVNFERVKEEIKAKGIELRGGAADEAPEVYKKLEEVLEYHKNTIEILHKLTPLGIAMAGDDIWDPYKD